MPEPTIKIDQFTSHPERDALLEDWRDYELLAEGGRDLYRNARRFLKQRPKEPPDVYQMRLDRFTYEGHVGAALSWYGSALFGESPAVELKDADQGQLDFWTRFEAGANRKRTADFWEVVAQWFTDGATFGRFCYLVDRPGGPYASRADELAADADPYLVRWSPIDVLNWSVEPRTGVVEQVVLYSERYAGGALGKKEVVRRWSYYDRFEFAIYEAPEDEKQEARLVDSGEHALAALGACPVRVCEFPKKLWLVNRAGLAAREHLSVDNGVSMACHVSNHAMPIVYSDRDIEVTVGPTAYIQMPETGRWEWTEPPGRALTASQERQSAKREEIYREMHMMAQGRTSTAQASVQSGYSKELDMAPTDQALEASGKVLAREIEACARLVMSTRDYDEAVAVHGFKFADKDPLLPLDVALRLRGLKIQSDRLYREADKLAAKGVLDKAPKDVIDTVLDEIEKGEGFLVLERERQRELLTAFQSGEDGQEQV